MNRFLIAAALVMAAASARAQTSPGFSTGFIPNQAQWNSYFAGKVDTTNGVINGFTDTGVASIAGLLTLGGGVTGGQTVSTAPGTWYYNQLNNTYSFSGGSGGVRGLSIASTVTGATNETGSSIVGEVDLNSSHGTNFALGASQWIALQGVVTKNTPSGGFSSNGGPGGWSLYLPYGNNTNLPSSISGSDTHVEADMWTNNLDTSLGRFGYQMSFAPQITAGYTAEIARPFYMNCGGSVWCGDLLNVGGNFEQAGLDFRFAATTEPKITSATPGSSVYSVTVDNVMPLASGGTAAGAGGFLGGQSTAAITGITAAANASGNALTVSAASGLPAGQSGEADYVTNGMYVIDLTNPSAIPEFTTVIAGAGTTGLTTSVSTTVAASDALIFSRGQKSVTFPSGDVAYVVGFTLPNQNSTAGTVYFQQAISVADATNGVYMTPNAHAIWGWEGNGTNVPPFSIAVNRAGTATIGSDGGTGVAINGTGLTQNVGVNTYTAQQIYTMACPGCTGAADGDAVLGTIGSGFTGAQQTGYAAYYVNNVASSGGFRNGVGFFTTGVCSANGSDCWGGNSLLTDNTSQVVSAGTSKILTGWEFDFNVTSPNTIVNGVTVTGDSKSQPAGSNGFLVESLGTGITWDTSFFSKDGVAHNALYAGLQGAPGNNVPSQYLRLASTNSSGTETDVTLDATGGNTLNLLNTTELAILNSNITLGAGVAALTSGDDAETYVFSGGLLGATSGNNISSQLALFNTTDGSGTRQAITLRGTNGDTFFFNSSGATHIQIGTTTAPAATSCGTGCSLSATASDVKGTVTEGSSATGFTLTFGVAYAGTPDCVVSSPTGSTITSYSVTTTALTLVNASASGDKFTYMCMQ